MIPSWTQFTADLTSRFGDLYDDPMAELKNLRQKGSVQDYHDSFDQIASKLSLTERDLLSCYIGGLEEEIQIRVRMFAPTTIQQACSLAKLQEAASKSQKNKLSTHKPPLLPTPNIPKLQPYTPNPRPSPQNYPPKNTNNTTNSQRPTPNQSLNRRTLTTTEFNDRRAKGLCFWCEEKFEPGHVCKGKRPQLYHVEVEELPEDVSPEEEERVDYEIAHISLQAMEGVHNFQTMRVVGQHSKRPLHILLDSGSTHNFLDTQKASRLGCKLESVPPVWVRVADGGRIKCDTAVKGFEWLMQGIKFSADVLLLPLSGSDMVLGVQWFTGLGPILWNFQELSMEFQYNGVKVKLRGAKAKQLKPVDGGNLHKKC